MSESFDPPGVITQWRVRGQRGVGGPEFSYAWEDDYGAAHLLKIGLGLYESRSGAPHSERTVYWIDSRELTGMEALARLALQEDGT